MYYAILIKGGFFFKSEKVDSKKYSKRKMSVYLKREAQSPENFLVSSF